MTRHQFLIAAPGVERDAAPWSVTDDGTVLAADGVTCICVLGDPLHSMTETVIKNGALILSAPDLLRAAYALQAVRPSNWDDDDDLETVAAWSALDQAVLQAEGAPS